jgi:hypothetical protein
MFKTRTSLTLSEKKDMDGKLGKVTFYCTEKESRGGKVLKILTFVAATMHLIFFEIYKRSL